MWFCFAPAIGLPQASTPALPPPKPKFESRFQKLAPCPSAPPVWIDRFGSGIGLAAETARNRGLQGRVLWIDATANIDRYNTEAKIQDLTGHIADSGFNTLVFDIKPISGQTVYPSKLAPKLLTWRGQSLPENFDPVPLMISEAHRRNLSVILSMNAFSEGHRLFKTGPGYAQPEHQTVLYVPQPIVRVGGFSFKLASGQDQVSSDQVSELSSISKAADKSLKDSFWVVLGSHRSVLATSEQPLTALPKGTILCGEGGSASFLRENARIGQTVAFDTQPTFVTIGDQPKGQIPLMMDSNDPEVQEHALAMIKEVLTHYEPDGLIYDDRLRYAGLDGDFSPISRSLFEKEVGHSLRWPDDVFKYTFSPNLTKGIMPGPYFDLWMSWRAAQIQAYVAKVRQTVSAIRPSAQFGAYVGSWYGDYPALGHNYASPDAEPGFWFATPAFRKAGTSPLLDYLMVGCYYETPTIYDAMGKGSPPGYTVEAGGALCTRLARSETWTYAGIDCGSFANDPDGLANAVQAACASTQGVMVFDLSHGMDNLWPTFKQIFGRPVKAPHMVPGLLSQVRAHRKQIDGYGQKEMPIIILNGSSGIGQ